MRSYIGRLVNRETEQALFNLMCSYLVYPDEKILGCYNRLHVFVRKNRYLGRIYVERLNMNGRYVSKCYYSQYHWDLENLTKKRHAIALLLRAFKTAKSGGVYLDVHKLVTNITESNTILTYGVI